MKNLYPTKITKKLTRATENQLKYWIKIGLVNPQKRGKTYYYTFRDIIKLRLINELKREGLSLQKIRQGISHLSKILPKSDDPLTKLSIHTDGFDMIVVEKGKYFSATTMQRFISFDTEKIQAEIIEIQKSELSIKLKNSALLAKDIGR